MFCCFVDCCFVVLLFVAELIILLIYLYFRGGEQKEKRKNNNKIFLFNHILIPPEVIWDLKRFTKKHDEENNSERSCTATSNPSSSFSLQNILNLAVKFFHCFTSE